MVKLSGVAMVFGLTVSLNGGAPRTIAPAPLTCVEDLEALKGKIQQDYAGFLLEVKGEKRVRHDKAFAALSRRAEKVTGDDCVFVLQDYIRWFEDPHLFLYQNTQLDSSESKIRAAAVQSLDMDEAKALAYFKRKGNRLDPLEGIWYDQALRVAIVPAPSPAKGAGQFVAVILESDTPEWRPGMIRARFTRQSDGRYTAAMTTRNFATQYLDARVHKRVLMRLSPGMFGKAFPTLPADSGLLDPFEVHRPTLISRAGTIIVSITSHDPGYKGYLDSLIAAHESELRSAERLIVDLRGNEGGASFMSNGLLPYIAGDSATEASDDFRRSVMLSSEDQMRYVGRMFGSDTFPQIQRMLTRMRAHPGELVPMFDSLDPPDPATRDSVIRGPKRVAIMIDRGTVSASEVLVLQALKSERVTVFGEPTAGALDYQSTAIVWFSPNERRWGLGYPTITANAEIPKGGMRGKGIAPQVRVDWSKIPDPIGFVERALRR